MTRSFLLASAAKDLRRRIRDPLSLVLWAGVPLVVGLVLKLAFGREGTPPQAHLLVADRDDSVVSRLLVGAFGQGGLSELIRVEAVEEGEGRERMDAGDASALLVVPEGFGAAVIEERPSRLTLVTNPAQQVLPGIVEESLSIFVDAVFYLQRLLAGPLALARQGPPAGATTLPDSTVSRISVEVNRIVNRVGPYVFPPAVELATEAGPAEPDEPGFAVLFFPGVVFMALLFFAQGLSEDVWRERSLGTLRRAVATPRSLAAFLGGKLLAGATLMAGVALVALLAGRWLFGIELANLPLALLWATLAGTALLALMVLVQLHAASERAGNMLTGAVIFPLAMLGGSFFPFEAMPDWMARIGRLTPNGWALQQFVALVRDRVEPVALAGALAGVVLVGGLAFALSARRLAAGFAQG